LVLQVSVHSSIDTSLYGEHSQSGCLFRDFAMSCSLLAIIFSGTARDDARKTPSIIFSLTFLPESEL
jgi:hypothetical protein